MGMKIDGSFNNQTDIPHTCTHISVVKSEYKCNSRTKILLQFANKQTLHIIRILLSLLSMRKMQALKSYLLPIPQFGPNSGDGSLA